jgi:hypothetical protein
MTFRLIDVNGIQFVGIGDVGAESKLNLADHIELCSSSVCAQ